MSVQDMTCDNPTLVKRLGEMAIDHFESDRQALSPDLCAPFYEAAARLETALIGIYRQVALCAEAETDLDRIASGWGEMESVCDDGLRALAKLIEDHPYCNAEVVRDQILDLRNKCHRLHLMHA